MLLTELPRRRLGVRESKSALRVGRADPAQPFSARAVAFRGESRPLANALGGYWISGTGMLWSAALIGGNVEPTHRAVDGDGEER
jgi:hypothetical protein